MGEIFSHGSIFEKTYSYKYRTVVDHYRPGFVESESNLVIMDQYPLVLFRDITILISFCTEINVE